MRVCGCVFLSLGDHISLTKIKTKQNCVKRNRVSERASEIDPKPNDTKQIMNTTVEEATKKRFICSLLFSYTKKILFENT